MRTQPVRPRQRKAANLWVQIIAGLALSFFAFGFAQQKIAKDWQATVKLVQDKYAPDRRTTVFQVDVSTDGDRVTATGEVESAAAKSELLRRLGDAGGGKSVIDEIQVLPDPALGTKNLGLVVVSVGNVRRDPGHPAELVTQVLLGDTVELLKKKNGWYYIHCSDRYLGWIDEDAIFVADTTTTGDWKAADLVRVVQIYGFLKTQPRVNAASVCDITIGNVLRRVSESGGWLELSLPDGRRGFVERAAIADERNWRGSRKLTAASIEATARSFMGVPYLWGGTSAKGFDCSGFVKIVFLLNGNLLNRDTDQQARQGEDAVAGTDFQNLRPGDLLFFGRRATDDRPERITHVAIYLGGRKFIHCSGRVRISSLDPSAPDYDEGHVKGFLRARRFITQ